MNMIGELLHLLERSSPGSVDTAEQVLSALGKIRPQQSLFVGDDTDTPRLMLGRLGGALKAAFTDKFRAEQGRECGLDSTVVQLYELPKIEGGFDLIWYNGIVEFDGCRQRLSELRGRLKSGGILIYRAISRLTEASADVSDFCQKRFGEFLPLDKIVFLAKESGWQVLDFYIAPKSDWTTNYYIPLAAAAEEYVGIHKEDSEVSLGMSELRKEVDIFNAHCEEYSCVYYILKG